MEDVGMVYGVVKVCDLVMVVFVVVVGLLQRERWSIGNRIGTLG